jgi:hypothetical protein
MTESETPQISPAGEPAPNSPALRAATYAIFLGLIGSALWDLVAKPGMGRVATALLSVAGALSSTVKDAPYSMAAIDPSTLPALLLLIIAAATALAAGLPRQVLSRLRGRRLCGARRTRISQLLRIAMRVYVGLFGIGAVVVTLTINQAILIRRVFTANLAICGPKFTEAERLAFAAEFAGIRTRAGYERLDVALRQAASARGVRLRPEKP